MSPPNAASPVRMSNPGSTASQSSWRSSSGTPSRMQIICIGSSAATSTRKSTSSPSPMRSRRTRGARPQLVLEAGDRARRESHAHEPPDPRVTRVVHHVEDDPGDLEVLQQRAAVLAASSALGGVGHRVAQHRERLGVGRNRPEPLAVGRVLRGLVPPHRRLAPVHDEQVVREPVREVVEIGEVDLRELHQAARTSYAQWRAPATMCCTRSTLAPGSTARMKSSSLVHAWPYRCATAQIAQLCSTMR